MSSLGMFLYQYCGCELLVIKIVLDVNGTVPPLICTVKGYLSSSRSIKDHGSQPIKMVSLGCAQVGVFR